MAEIDYNILTSFLWLMESEPWYVLDFSNNTFQKIVAENIWIDIYWWKWYEDYCSKMNKLRQIIKQESDYRVVKLMKALINYYEDYRLKIWNLTDYDKKKIAEIKEYIELHSIKGAVISNELNKKFQEISTRNARFEEMSTDEKLEEIVSLIENMLNNNWKWLEIDPDFTLWILTNEDVKEYRKILQIFRHDKQSDINERAIYTENQKEFLIQYWIFICNVIYKWINKV